jgi:hypothetical protein
MSRNLEALTLLDSFGPAWPVMGVLYLYLYYKMLGPTIKISNSLFTTSFTWTGLELSSGFVGKKPGTNRIVRGSAKK